MNTCADRETERVAITRRHFLKLGTLGAAALGLGPWDTHTAAGKPYASDLAADSECLAREEDFFNVGRGKSPPHELSDEQRRAVGLTGNTWQLEVVPDQDRKPNSGAGVSSSLCSQISDLRQKHKLGG